MTQPQFDRDLTEPYETEPGAGEESSIRELFDTSVEKEKGRQKENE
jgi:hypothetical protein